jgi:hypothetical protein
MTSRARFGDFAVPVPQHLAAAARQVPEGWRPNAVDVAVEAGDFVTAVRPVLTAMGRYLADVAAIADAACQPGDDGEYLARSRHQAAVRALRNWQNAVRSLPPVRQAAGRRRPPARPATSAVARHLLAAAQAMTVGRDLLQTHVTTDLNGEVQYRSPWAPAVTSPQASNALLAEVGWWSRQLASHAARLAAARPGYADPTPAQRSVEGLRDHLSAVVTTIGSACTAEPVTAADIRRLHAIPVNVMPERRRPVAGMSVAELCRGISDCAERLHHAAVDSSQSPASGASANSLRDAAASAMAITRHCQVIGNTLAVRARELGDVALAQALQDSALSLAQANRTWIAAASAWSCLHATTSGGISSAAAESADLAQWTGRLAYASPAWSMRTGRASQPRQPGKLAPRAPDIGHVAATLSNATNALTALAAADYAHVRAIARSGHLIVPVAEMLPGGDVAVRFEPASVAQPAALLTACSEAGLATVYAAQATAQASHIADTPGTKQPRADTPASNRPRPPARQDLGHDDNMASSRLDAALRAPPEKQPGPVERILRELGTAPELLRRAQAIDDTTRQIITEATRHTAPQRWDTAVTKLNAVADTRQIIHHVTAPDPATPSRSPARPAGHRPQLQHEDPEAGQ